MRTLRVLSVLLIGLLSLWLPDYSLAAMAPPAANPADIHWSYQAETGPDFWADLDAGFATCASGKSQSPIDLGGAEDADLLNPEFHYEPVPLNLLNNGHTVQVPYAPGSYVLLDGTRYDLLQFHFHSPSEHTIGGRAEDAELHLVHQNEVGELAVVAVLLHADTGSDTVAYQPISQNLPLKAGDKIRTGKTINAEALLPSRTTTYRYIGSLTTPPCSESVIWLVMSHPILLSEAQLARYEKLLNHNNRPLQVLNERTIRIDSTS
ncbi:MAG: carbonic anhydrase [Phormidesmis sp.]